MPTVPCDAPCSPAHRRLRAPLARAALLSMLALVWACDQQNLIPEAHPDPAELLWGVTLNHHAVALSTRAPYDELQLAAVPRNFRGDPLTDLPPPHYQSSDPDKVIVTEDGLLVAVAPTTQPVEVIATITAQNLRHADTVIVSVVADPAPPVLESLSIQPVPPDSAKTFARNGAIGLNVPPDTLPVRAAAVGGGVIRVYSRDSAGVLPVAFRSSDPYLAMIAPYQEYGAYGVLKPIRPGVVTIYASTTAFGVAKADTLVYRIGLPLLGLVGVDVRRPDGSVRLRDPDLVLGVGGAVVWILLAEEDFADTVDITFHDAGLTNVMAVRPVVDRLATFNSYAPLYFCSFDCDNGGSFFLSGSQPEVGRYFAVPGTYEYRSARHGFSGRVVVVDEP